MWSLFFIIIFNRLQKIIVSLFIVFFTSCSFIPESLGEDNEILVIVSPEDKPFIKKLMADLFLNVIHTPQPEFEFNLSYKSPWEIEKIKEYGNIIIASLDFPEDSTGDYLMERMVQAHRKDNPLFVLSDLYAKNQLICGK